MKIALVSQEYPPETAKGGIGSQTYAKAKGMASLGHEVFVISRSINDTRSEINDGNISIIRIPGMENVMPAMTMAVEWITHSIVVAAEIETLHQRVALDIIDFPEWAAEPYTYLLNRSELNSVPVVIQLHGPLVMLAHSIGWPQIESEFYRVGTQMEALCVRLADAVYSSSACSAKWIEDHYDPQKENIPVIHVGIDSKKFYPKPVQKNERLTIIFTGKIVPNKGVLELVEAASRLAKEFPGLQLRMIGRGDEKFIIQLRNIAEKNGAQDLLNFLGFIHADDLAEEFSRAHLFAAPSWYEGGPGFVYLEAMACGLLVIGCSGSGVEEIIQHGINGMLVPPHDAVALENVLCEILSNAVFAATMGIAARDFVLKACERNACLKKLEDFYYSIVNKNAFKAATK